MNEKNINFFMHVLTQANVKYFGKLLGIIHFRNNVFYLVLRISPDIFCGFQHGAVLQVIDPSAGTASQFGIEAVLQTRDNFGKVNRGIHKISSLCCGICYYMEEKEMRNRLLCLAGG